MKVSVFVLVCFGFLSVDSYKQRSGSCDWSVNPLLSPLFILSSGALDKFCPTNSRTSFS